MGDSLAASRQWHTIQELFNSATPPHSISIGLEESQWRTYAQAIAAWEDWLATVQSRILTDQEQADLAVYEAEHRRFNLEAMRQQMAKRCGHDGTT